MPIELLLAMQAAGMIFDYIGTKNQANMMASGQELQQASMDANLAQIKLGAQNESLSAMQNLRQTIGSQLAVFAARGTQPGAGSAAISLNQSQTNFNQAQQTRNLNELAKENQIKTQSMISKLQGNADISKLWQGFAGRTLNMIPTNITKLFGGGAGSSQGYGLTSAQ